ncbi:hypothetical protein QR680_013927 [Steinernema hermaphroditum]|uniref:Uncharacterized protein n=1 Tax=Steinernema hermaphroditum TaxID=289476 RepID=A0AA39M327_9BILA|nr:hypothetical protein QR680_013927 [Steinernema hermaphroditum]
MLFYSSVLLLICASNVVEAGCFTNDEEEPLLPVITDSEFEELRASMAEAKEVANPFIDSAIEAPVPIFQKFAAPAKFFLKRIFPSKDKVEGLGNEVVKSIDAIGKKLDAAKHRIVCKISSGPFAKTLGKARELMVKFKNLYEPKTEIGAINARRYMRNSCNCTLEQPINLILSLLQGSSNFATDCLKDVKFISEAFKMLEEQIRTVALVYSTHIATCHLYVMQIPNVDLIGVRLKRIYKDADRLKEFYKKNVAGGIRDRMEDVLMEQSLGDGNTTLHPKLVGIEAKINQVLSEYRHPKGQYHAYFWVTDGEKCVETALSLPEISANGADYQFKSGDVNFIIRHDPSISNTSTNSKTSFDFNTQLHSQPMVPDQALKHGDPPMRCSFMTEEFGQQLRSEGQSRRAQP